MVGCWGKLYVDGPSSSGSSFDGAPSNAVRFASSLARSFDSSEVIWSALMNSSSSGSPPAGPGTGVRPSRKAFAMSAAFHLLYLILSRF